MGPTTGGGVAPSEPDTGVVLDLDEDLEISLWLAFDALVEGRWE
jgi:hypothetical protein